MPRLSGGNRGVDDYLMSYDINCYKLAEHFLADTSLANDDAATDALAQEIQDAIEFSSIIPSAVKKAE
jgi:hypothetical protein